MLSPSCHSLAESGLVDQLLQIQAGRIGNQLELELGGVADQFQGPLRILDAGQLDDDFILALADNDRFGDAELVDPVAEDFQGLVNGIVLDEVSLLSPSG